MESVTNGMQAFSLSGPPSSLSSSTSNIFANTVSSSSSRRPSSATSISSPATEADMPSRKPSQDPIAAPAVSVPTTPTKPKPSTSDESILDDFTQGHTRALRRQALARKISAHLRTLPAPSSTTSSSSTSSSRKPSLSDDDNDEKDPRTLYIDTLVAREPEVYTPALAAYFADHPELIPTRAEDAATRRRKRYDEHEVVTDRSGRTTRVDMRQNRLFQGWEWSAVDAGTRAGATGTTTTKKALAAGARARDGDRGPMGERERGEETRCAHCERADRREEVKRVARKGLRKFFGRKGKGGEVEGPVGGAPEKWSRKAMVEDQAAHAEQVERVV